MDLLDYGPGAVTRFDFDQKDTHHVKLVCENEIVVMYVDEMKCLTSRISHSTDGAHIGFFSLGCNAGFSDIVVRIPEQ